MRTQRILLWSSRLGSWAICLVIAICAIGTQLDFATRTNPELASVVPKPFKAHAYAPLARRSLKSQEQASNTSPFVNHLVLARPVPAETLSILAVSENRRGAAATASRAITAGAERGWRDQAAQLAMGFAALDVKDWTILAQRVDALERTGFDTSKTALWQALLQSPSGRSALASRLIQERNWLDELLADAHSKQSANEIAKTVDLIHQADGWVDCKALSRASRRWMRQKKFEAAAELWGGRCVEARQDFGDGFVPPEAVMGPTDWIYPRRPGLRRSFSRNDQSVWAISYRNNEQFRLLLAERYLMLDEGNYVAKFGGGFDQSAPISLQIACEDENRSLVHGPVQTASQSFEVPAGCSAQRLRIMVEQGAGELITLTIIKTD